MPALSTIVPILRAQQLVAVKQAICKIEHVYSTELPETEKVARSLLSSAELLDNLPASTLPGRMCFSPHVLSFTGCLLCISLLQKSVLWSLLNLTPTLPSGTDADASLCTAWSLHKSKMLVLLIGFPPVSQVVICSSITHIFL